VTRQTAVGIRDDVVRPPRLLLPQRPPAVVYLDLNHYINMAKVIAGKITVEGYPELLASARRAAAEGRAVFVLSATHLMEVTAIKDPKQRSNIADVMAELSGFTYMLGRPLVEELEVEGSLAELLGPEMIDLKPINLLGYGAAWPFGMVTSWSPQGAGKEAFERIRAMIGAAGADQFLAQFRREAEMVLLHGGDTGHPAGNWRSMLANRASREIGQAALIDADSNYPMDKLRAVVSAGELLHELNDMVARRIALAGKSLAEVLPTAEVALAFTDGMPSTRVAISMKTHYFKNADNKWSTNDVSDIDALSVAAAYCDAVYSDKKAMNAVTSSPDLRLFGTFIPRKPGQMADWLDACPAPAVG
jgi:hypothetical protein